MEIDEKFSIFKGGLSVVDIGAAPGSWSQYAEKKIKNGKLISIDLKEMEPLGKSIQIQGDFTEDKIKDEILKSNPIVKRSEFPLAGRVEAVHAHKENVCYSFLSYGLPRCLLITGVEKHTQSSS